MRRTQSQLSLSVLALALISCQPKQATVSGPQASPLLRASQALNVTSSAINTAAITVIKLSDQGTLTKEEAGPILDAIGRTAQGGLQATEIIRSLNSLSDTDRQSLLKVTAPMMSAVHEALERHLINLSKPAQEKVYAVLVGIQSALTATDLILQAAH